MIDLEVLVITATQSHFGVDLSKEKKSRKEKHVYPRQVAHYLLKKYTKLTLRQIGMYVGDKTHQDVMHSIKVIINYLETKSEKTKDIQAIEKVLDIKKVYISGGITGTDYRQVDYNFTHAKNTLEGKGYNVVSPWHELAKYRGKAKTWSFYMIESFKLLDTCSTIYMLKNWRKSRGAIMELRYAKWKGLNVVFEKSNNL